MNLKMKMLIAACAGLFAASASAGTIYAVNDSNNTLVTIDRTTFVQTTIGSLGIAGDFGDLTYNATNNTLYAVGGRDNNSLYTVNRSTGAATLVGMHGINDMFSLAFDSSTNTMYGQSADKTVYQLNMTTGAATVIGANTVYPGGFAYNGSSNQLLMLEAGGGGNVYEINRATGGATLLQDTGSPVNDNGFTWDPEFNGYWAADWSASLYFFDAAFNRSQVANLGSSFAAIAFVNDTGNNVPEPASLALLAFGLAGLAAARRKKPA